MFKYTLSVVIIIAEVILFVDLVLNLAVGGLGLATLINFLCVIILLVSFDWKLKLSGSNK